MSGDTNLYSCGGGPLLGIIFLLFSQSYPSFRRYYHSVPCVELIIQTHAGLMYMCEYVFFPKCFIFHMSHFPFTVQGISSYSYKKISGNWACPLRATVMLDTRPLVCGVHHVCHRRWQLHHYRYQPDFNNISI